jgi:hypothetical protein
MKALSCILLLAAAHAAEPSDAIRKTIATFNDPHQRASVLARDADLSPLDRFTGQEVSQVYFEATAIRLVTPDVAFVNATASQFGSMIMKRTMPAVFVLKREAGAWRISVMRIAAPRY